MLRTALWTLRQRRYRALAALMFLLAVACIGLGTWQIYRFSDKRHDNAALTANAHAARVPLTTALVPLTGHGETPTREAIRYRTVTVSGSYDVAAQQFVQDKTVGGQQGFYVLTPLHTADGVVLVVRGFVASTSNLGTPSPAAPPPTGPVTITARLETASGSADHATPDGRVETINPTDQAARLGAPVFQAYLQLGAKQPGTARLTVLPGPDLSNPAGGAEPWQNLAYVIQWFIFAGLALFAPFLMGRHEVRDAQRIYLGIDPAQQEFDALPAGPDAGSDSNGGGELAVRDAAGELMLRSGRSPEQWARAARLADRYGRSLGPEAEQAGLTRVRWRRGGSGAPAGPDVPTGFRATRATSAEEPHRSEDDAYHAEYNDQLWQLAMSDGQLPRPTVEPDAPATDDERPQTD